MSNDGHISDYDLYRLQSISITTQNSLLTIDSDYVGYFRGREKINNDPESVKVGIGLGHNGSISTTGVEIRTQSSKWSGMYLACAVVDYNRYKSLDIAPFSGRFLQSFA